jgi:hypothetical protein
LFSYCKKLQQPPQPSATTQPPPWSVSSHQYRGKSLQQQKDYDSLKVQLMSNIFSNKGSLIKVCTVLFGHNAIAHLIHYSIV